MISKIKKRILMSIMALTTVVTATVGCTVEAAADTYIYDLWDKSIPAPDAYAWADSVRASDLGIDAIDNISDIFYKNDKVYIAISTGIVVTDKEFKTELVIEDYEGVDGEKKKVSNPQCVFVTDDDQIYITEEDAGEIVQFDEKGSFVRCIGDPHITGLSVSYAPSKVVVDDYGRIYVKAKNVYEGIIELDPTGKYNCFVGANEVAMGLVQRIYRNFATEEQISRMALMLPTSYSDISLDKDGYLLASVNEALSAEPIKRLNADGKDILGTYEYLTRPLGDYLGNLSNSTMITVSAAEDGRFAAIDSTMSRIFVYSEDGLMAYVIGNSGKTKGALSSPVDVTFMGDKILIADLVSKSIEVYEPTEYGQLINDALRSQSDYDYTKAAEYFRQAYDIYPNSILVNMGLGKQALRDEKYEDAMAYFKASGDRTSYSAAYERVREKELEKHIGPALISIIALVLIMALLIRTYKKKDAKGDFKDNRFVKGFKKFAYTAFKWPGYVIASPFKAFDDVKYDDDGNMVFCWIVLILYAWVNLFKVKYAGFIVNTNNTATINVPLTLASSVFPIIIFTVGNWAVGTLIDGKGNLKNIFKVNMYALYPTIFFYIAGTLLSRIIILEESTIVRFLFVFPMAVYVFYCFIGLLMVHQFTLKKGIASVLLSFVAMAIIIFIVTLLLTLISSFVNDWGTIFSEMALYLF